MSTTAEPKSRALSVSPLADALDLPARQARFSRLCEEALRHRHEPGLAGIGTLGEKRLHAVIKHYLTENEDYHEVGFPDCRFVADVAFDDAIYEVQTGSFAPLREKIAYYLANTDRTVTVVHPVAAVRRMSWVDRADGSVTPPRRVAGERPRDLLPALYPLIPYLSDRRLRFRLLLIETQDFRLLDDKKSRRAGHRRGGKLDRVPIALLDDLTFSVPRDYLSLLPSPLPDEPFPVKQFARQTGIYGVDSYSAVRVLCALGLLRPAEPAGRAMTFARTEV